MKPGLPLREISAFPATLTDYLRDELSVTTAEEFLGLAQSSGPGLERAVGQPLAPLLEAVRRELSPAVQESIRSAAAADYSFRTGHQAPH